MKSRIYFVQGDGGGPIKIGVSTDIGRRLKDMQTGSPVMLVLLAHCPGDIVTEFEFHERFAKHRLSGEWFTPHEEIVREIAAIREAVDQVLPVLVRERRPQSVLDRTERQHCFMAETLAAALPVIYGRGPHWKRQAVADTGLTERAIDNWTKGNVLPQMAVLITACRNNPKMYFWFLCCTSACWLADEIGVSEIDAMQALLLQPEAPLKLWKTKSNKTLIRLLRGVWATHTAREAAPPT